MEVNTSVTSIPMSEIDAAVVFRTNGKTVVYIAQGENGTIAPDSPEFNLAVMLKLFGNEKARTVASIMVALELADMADEEAAEKS